MPQRQRDHSLHRHQHPGPGTVRQGPAPQPRSAEGRRLPAQRTRRAGAWHFGFYGLYYCSQATFQLGDNYWDFFRPLLHDVLFRNQKDNGSWIVAAATARYGPNYCTAMCVLALTVEYRFLPIYQRDEEPTDKK